MLESDLTDICLHVDNDSELSLSLFSLTHSTEHNAIVSGCDDSEGSCFG